MAIAGVSVHSAPLDDTASPGPRSFWPGSGPHSGPVSPGKKGRIRRSGEALQGLWPKRRAQRWANGVRGAVGTVRGGGPAQPRPRQATRHKVQQSFYKTQRKGSRGRPRGMAPERGGGRRLHEDLDAVADGLAADGAGAERRAARRARAVATLEHEADVAVDANRAGDALLHLPVAALQLLHQLPRRASHGGCADHLRSVCGRGPGQGRGLGRRSCERTRTEREPRQGAGPWTAGRAAGGCSGPHLGAAGRGGRRAPPGRSFLLMTTWHLMHFFILRAHSAGGGHG